MSIHALVEPGIGIHQRRRDVQIQQRRQHPADFLGPHPRCVFDARLIIRHRGGVSGEALQAGAIGHPGRE
ncbi:hypothetical protein D3C76_1485270 [compost metagenome]